MIIFAEQCSRKNWENFATYLILSAIRDLEGCLGWMVLFNQHFTVLITAEQLVDFVFILFMLLQLVVSA